MAESLDAVQQRLNQIKAQRLALTPPRAQTPPRLARPVSASISPSLPPSLSLPRSVTPPRLVPPARAAVSLPQAPKQSPEPEPQEVTRPEQGGESQTEPQTEPQPVDVADVQAELEECLNDRRDLIEEFLGAEYRETENLSEELFLTIADPTHRNEAREALEELEEHIQEMRQQLGVTGPAPTTALDPAPATAPTPAPTPAPAALPTVSPANLEPPQPRTAAPQLSDPQQAGPAPPPALDKPQQQQPTSSLTTPPRPEAQTRSAPAISLLQPVSRKAAPPLPLLGVQATQAAANATADKPSTIGGAVLPALPLVQRLAPSMSAQPTAQPSAAGAAAPLPAALTGAPRSAPPLAALAAARRGSAASSVSDMGGATPAAMARTLSVAPPLPALTPATSLPPFGSQYRVVRKGQHYRADASPKSKKVGKLQIGEALIVQGAEMVDGQVRVLVARPTATDFVTLGWASVAVKGKTHLAPVGHGGIEEVEVFDGEDDLIDDTDDDAQASEEMSVELWSEGEYGFGISIGEASEVVAPEEEAAQESSQACRTVVTLVDEGCAAQRLGVKVGMELLRIGSEDLAPHGDAAVERAFEIVEEQLASGVGVPGGDPLVWGFRRPRQQTAGSPRRRGATKLMLRQFEVVRPATVRNGIGLNSKALGQLQVGQMIVAMAQAECDGHLRLQITSDPEQWVSASVPDGTVLLRERGVIGIEDFGQVDTDGDGFMTKSEFAAYRQKQTGQPPTAADWDAFNAADVDGDGQVSIEEFQHYRDAIADHYDSNLSVDNRAAAPQQQRRSVTFANQETEPLELQDQPLEWTEADIEQLFSTYDRDMDGLLDYEDILDILVHEMGYADDDGTAGVADGLLREFGEEIEVDQGDDQYAYMRMLDFDHWMALCNHLLPLVQRAAVQEGYAGGQDDGNTPFMPRRSATEAVYGDDHYEYDAETGGLMASDDEYSFLRQQVGELERRNNELTLQVKRGEQERFCLFAVLVCALVAIVLMLFFPAAE